jgi:predicted HicB family RNase H-like nuclease
MEKYKQTKKKYNSDKTFVQISKELHQKLKEHCKESGISVKYFLENLITKNI